MNNSGTCAKRPLSTLSWPPRPTAIRWFHRMTAPWHHWRLIRLGVPYFRIS